ncbi:MAG: type II secretion system protein, partial [Candidatus Uhrbacteria bacterium]|nr:type II secretion system protein [Candidatus Uhrbacteria bacterium]
IQAHPLCPCGLLFMKDLIVSAIVGFMKHRKGVFRTRGFTLVELLVVIAIIGMMSSVVLASVSAVRGKARDAQRVVNVNQIANAIALYEIDSGGVPPGVDGVEYINGNPEWIPGLVPKYIRAVPSDPLDSEDHKFHYSRQGNDYEVISFLEQNGNQAACGDGGSSCQYYEKTSGTFLAIANPGASGWRFSSTTEVVTLPPPVASTTPNTTSDLPAPTSLRVGFGIGSGVGNWVKVEESLSFNFDVGSLSGVSAFRLYQKRPQDPTFGVVGEFADPSSLTLCPLTRIYGTWDLAPISPNCPGSAWHISRTSLYPVSSYTVGDYLYYVKALDASGREGPSSTTGTATFLGTFLVTVETSGAVNPTFRWQAAGGSSRSLSYWVIVAPSDGSGSQQMLTPFSSSGPDIFKIYDGVALVPGKEYSVWVYGRSHSSDQSEDWTSFASGVATFTATSTP